MLEWYQEEAEGERRGKEGRKKGEREEWGKVWKFRDVKLYRFIESIALYSRFESIPSAANL